MFRNLQLCDLYENDSIFDKFECCLSGDGQRVATGSYRYVQLSVQFYHLPLFSLHLPYKMENKIIVSAIYFVYLVVPRAVLKQLL